MSHGIGEFGFDEGEFAGELFLEVDEEVDVVDLVLVGVAAAGAGVERVLDPERED